MKRPFIAGVMGLALAGCAHSRSDVAQDSGRKNPVGPVALQPVPSIHDTINRGTGNAALAQTALRDPNDPHWSGRAPDPGAKGPAATGPAPAESPESVPRMATAEAPPARPASPGPASEPAAPEMAGAPRAGAPDRLSGRPSPADPTEGAKLSSAPDVATAAAAAAATMPGLPASGRNPFSAGGPPTAGPAPSSTATAPAADSVARVAEAPAPAGGPSPTAAIPYTLERPGGPMPEMLARPAGEASGAPPMADPAATAPVPPGSGPESPAVAGPSMNGLEPVGAPPGGPRMAATPAPSDPSVSPSAGPAAQGAGKPRPAGDPLLGPSPDLMPELPPLPSDMPPAAGPAAARPAASPRAPTTPAPTMPAGPGELPPVVPPDPPPAPTDPVPSGPPELGGPSADNRPAGAGQAAVSIADLPPLEPVVRLQSAAPEDAVRTAPAVAPISLRHAVARRDGQILRASHRPADDPEAAAIPVSYRQASMIAAKVGDETITMHDLIAVVRENCKRRQIPYDRLPRQQKEEICRGLMNELVNQSLLIQESKRTIKNAKMYDHFVAEAERFWHDDQLPKLEIEFAADNESQLREKLKEHGRSLETISRMTRRGWMAEAFLHARMKDKIKVELPELLRYYSQHVRDRGFDRPAQITWREIVVETSPQTTSEQARRKIEAIRLALARGADFAATARAQSEGPSRSREQGGLMQTSPGSYGVPSVNAALNSLPIGQISGILEGPSSFHIIRVESRRAAGPAAFDELQDEIKEAIAQKKFQTERNGFIQKLRDETFVTTFLDDDLAQTRRVQR